MDWSEFPYSDNTQEATDDEIRINLVRCAIEQNRVENLRPLLEDIAASLPQEGPGLVHLAVKAQALPCLECLVKRGIPVDDVDETNRTPLHIAIADMWFQGVLVLLEAKADIQGAYGGREQTATEQQNSQTPGEIWIGQKTALHLAVGRDSVQILQAIVDRARPRDDYLEIVNVAHLPARMTPLMIAVSEGKFKFVKILLDNGADVTLINEDGQSVLHMAVKKRFHNIIELLFRANSKEVKELSKIECKGIFKGTPLLLAVHQNDFQSLKILAEVVGASFLDTCDMNVSKDRKKCTVLHLAALCGNGEIIDYFIPKLKGTLKRLVAAKTEQGSTPLKFAFKMQEIKFAHALLAAGSDLTTQSADGRTDMDALIYYLESPVQFMMDVLNRSFKKDYTKRSVVAKYTVLMPQDCCQADGGHDSSDENQATAPVASVPAESGHTQPRVSLRIDNNERRTNGEVAIPLLSRPNSTRNHDAQDIGPANASSQSRPSSQINSPEGQVTVNIPNEENPSESHRENAEPSVGLRNHFGVLKELEKMGEVLKQMTILEHPLVESYLYLYWMKISGPYKVLLGLNFIFGVLLVITSAISIATYANSDDNDTAPLDRDEINENTTSDVQYGVHSDIWLKILVVIPMLLLTIYEVQCLSTRDRPLKYWLQSGLALFCFCATIWWLGTNQTTPFLIAFFMAWIQFAILILDLRQCHGFGRVVVHFIKTISGLRDVLFGFLIFSASVIVWGGGPDYFILRFKGVDNSDVALNITLFSVTMLLCIICFVCFLLILAYSIITYNDNYVGKEKKELIVQQIKFLEIYEKYLFEKPLGFGDRGLIYSIYKGICISVNHISKLCWKNRELVLWKEFEAVKREYHVYSNYYGVTRNGEKGDSVETQGTSAHPSNESDNRRVIFPKELELEIFITERKNRENVTAQFQASARESIMNQIKSMMQIINNSSQVNLNLHSHNIGRDC